MTGSGRWPRLLIRLSFLLAAVLLLWPLLPWEFGPKFAVQASPFIAVCSSIAGRTISIGAGIGLALAVFALMRRRVFCRYICPTGLLLEGASYIGFKKTSWWGKCPSLGPYAALLTLFGAVVGYPLLFWMDPLALFSSSFSIWRAADLISGMLAGAGLGMLILASFLMGTVWCSRICPLGGMQELLASIRSRFGKPEGSTSSRQPLSLEELKSPARRIFLAGIGGIGLGFWAKKVGASKAGNAPLRPPGAVDESCFSGKCVRCGNCVRACPSKIIHPDTGEAGFAGLLAPLVRFDNSRYCREDCIACTQICPSGALQSLSLERKSRYIIGEALVDSSLCLLALGQKECDACVRACPYDAIHIYWDEEYYIAYPVADREKCNGCGACQVVCPTEGVKAVQVWKKMNR